jgi:hypothetical protein
MFKYIIWAIIIYLLVRFIFDFLIPVIRTARRMKGQMKDFQDRMNSQQYHGNVDGQGFQENVNQQQTQAKRAAEKPKAGDYIDFEEIK